MNADIAPRRVHPGQDRRSRVRAALIGNRATIEGRRPIAALSSTWVVAADDEQTGHPL